MVTSVGYPVIESINCRGLALDGDLDIPAGLNGVPGGSAPSGKGRRSPALVAGPGSRPWIKCRRYASPERITAGACPRLRCHGTNSRKCCC